MLRNIEINYIVFMEVLWKHLDRISIQATENIDRSKRRETELMPFEL